MSSNYPDNVSPTDPEAPWNQDDYQPEPMDDTTKIDVLLTAMDRAGFYLERGWVITGIRILADAKREVLGE